MHRRKFIGVTMGGVIAAAASTAYLLSDRKNLQRADMPSEYDARDLLQPDEREILALASLAPSGHNTQPWFIRRIEPYRWIIGNDSARWLPAVDPQQRETILSIGAFLQNLDHAAQSLGYRCHWTLLARTSQDERVMEVVLVEASARTAFDTATITSRRTVRAGFQRTTLSTEHVAHLSAAELAYIHYLPAAGKEARTIDEQTIEANRLQAYRDPAQQELADWIRFSSDDARKNRDGLTTAGLGIEGVSG